MKRKPLSALTAVIIAAAMLTSSMPLTSSALQASADSPVPVSVTIDTYGDFEYRALSNTDTATISKYNGIDTEVEIPAEINGRRVTEISDSAFKDCDVENVIIPESVTDISVYAFEDTPWYESAGDTLIVGDHVLIKYDTDETEITIPKTVKKIAKGLFSDRTSITKVTIPDSVQIIGERTFSGCTSLVGVTIPDSVQTIGESAFSGCTSLAEIVIPNSVTEIVFQAFSGCTSLTDITIPSSVTDISAEVFSGCTSLKNVTIPEGVTSIGSFAFSGCTSLTDTTIPESVASIGESAFRGLDSLVLNVYKGSYALQYAKDNHLKYVILNASNDGATDISYFDYSLQYDGTVEIEKYLGSVANVVIPSEIEGAPVTSIWDAAFADCTSLESVVIPDSVTYLANNAFSGCTSLKDVTVPDLGGELNVYTFNGCTAIENMYIKENSEYYSSVDGIIYNKDQTKLIYCPPTKQSAVILDSVKEIDGCAFSSCSLIKSIILPEGVTSIGWYAFSDCTSLESINFPDTLTSIDEGAFSGCISIVGDITLNTMETISTHAFSGCTSLESVTMDGSVSNIGYGAFSDCTSLQSVTIGSSVQSIEYAVFFGCKSLKSVTILNPEASIDNDAFAALIWYDDLTIRGYSGSTAEEFASYKVFPFESLGEAPAPKPDGAFGDIDGDGQVTSSDALAVLRMSVGLDEYDDDTLKIADVDGDGSVTSADALILLRVSVGLKDD